MQTISLVIYIVSCAGLTLEEMGPLALGQGQRTALLQSLLQLKRLRLVMRCTQRTYTLA